LERVLRDETVLLTMPDGARLPLRLRSLHGSDGILDLICRACEQGCSGGTFDEDIAMVGTSIGGDLEGTHLLEVVRVVVGGPAVTAEMKVSK
jgi:5,10-methenyltetrahydromethanopterin hydrogenase